MDLWKCLLEEESDENKMIALEYISNNLNVVSLAAQDAYGALLIRLVFLSFIRFPNSFKILQKFSEFHL